MFGFEIFNRNPLTIHLPLGRGLVAVTVTWNIFMFRGDVAVINNCLEDSDEKNP